MYVGAYEKTRKAQEENTKKIEEKKIFDERSKIVHFSVSFMSIYISIRFISGAQSLSDCPFVCGSACPA